jgi:SAM-dependent methyltransferase
VGRYFEYGKDAIAMFSRTLPFLNQPSVNVLEVGSGSGFFTSILFRINPDMRVTCLEPDASFVETLRARFGERVTVVPARLGDAAIPSAGFDVAISHIVVHNLIDPVRALSKMRRVVRRDGYVVAIDPLPASRQYFPSEEVELAAALLHEVKVYRSVERQRQLGASEGNDPWRRNYPQLFDQAGLVFLSCYGWTSVFTLSDRRYPFSERKKWLQMRYDLVSSSRERVTEALLRAGREKAEIDQAHQVMLAYLRGLIQASEEELNRTHEQEIVHRIITIGRK